MISSSLASVVLICALISARMDADDVLRDIDQADLVGVRKLLVEEIAVLKLAGVIDREGALKKAAEYSRPRWPTLREYAQIVGFNLEEAIQRINAAPKLY